MHDETEILQYFDLEREKRLIDDTIVYSDDRHEKESHTAKTLINMRIPTETEKCSKKTGSVRRSLRDAEQRLANVWVTSASVESSNRDTLPKDRWKFDNEQKDNNGHDTSAGQ